MAIQSDLGLLLLLPILPVLLVLIQKRKRQRGDGPRPKLPPGPPRLPIVGNLHQLGKIPHRTLWELSKQYGPIMQLQLGGVPTVVVSSAHMAREILKTHDLDLCSRPAMIALKRFSYNYSDVAFSPYSTAWREQKKLLVLKLLHTRKVDGFRQVREEEVEGMMSSISSLASLSKPVNLSELLHILSYNITCRAAFGQRFYCGGQAPGQENRFHSILHETQALLVGLFVGDYFPWAEWVDVLSGQRGRLDKNFAELDAFYQEVIEAHVSKKKPIQDEEDFVDVLLRLQREDAHLTQDHIKGVFMNVLLGGTDTSSAALEYAMAELVRNPSAMVRAQEEVRSTVGNKGKVEERDISQFSYVKCVVKETLRLHPVAPLLAPHEAMSHINIDGYDLPAGTRVIVNAWAIGREPASWEKPEEFIPEKFLNSDVDFKGHDLRYIPFGAGRRACPGVPFGILTVELALSNLLYAFDWEVPDGMRKEDISMEEAAGIAIHLKTNLLLKAVLPDATTIEKTRKNRAVLA